MKAVISVVAMMQDVSIDTFLNWEMCRDMVDSGLLEIGSHSYALHNLRDLGDRFNLSGVNGIQRETGESDDAFDGRVLADLRRDLWEMPRRAVIIERELCDYMVSGCGPEL